MNDADLPVMWQEVCRNRSSPGETRSAAAEGGTIMPYSWHSFQVRVVASSVSLAKAFASATSSCRQSQPCCKPVLSLPCARLQARCSAAAEDRAEA